MIQQVNLYQDCLKKEQQASAVKRYVIGLLGFITVLFCLSIYLFLALASSKNNLASAEEQLIVAKNQTVYIQAKYPKQPVNVSLNQKIVASQLTLDGLTQVIGYLSDESSDQVQGFSRYFRALALQSVAEVWLRKITINGKDNTLTFQGSTYIPSKIPVMLKNLHYEPVFQGKVFSKLIMSQAADDVKRVDFTVTTLADFIEQKSNE